jgi:hypothetical protein
LNVVAKLKLNSVGKRGMPRSSKKADQPEI